MKIRLKILVYHIDMSRYYLQTIFYRKKIKYK